MIRKAKDWNDIFLTEDPRWDIGYPSPPITKYFDQVEDLDAKILIPGCGNSYEGQYLWECGFDNVTLLDFAEESKKNFLDRVEDFPPNQFLLDSFFDHEGQYDYIVEQTFFCALHPSQRIAYADKMHELLKPGGKLIGVMFNAPKNSDHPPYGGSTLEYLGYFQPKFSGVRINPCYNSIKPRKGAEVFINIEK